MDTNSGLPPDPSEQQHAANTPHAERNWRAAISGQQPAFVWLMAAFLGGAAISAAPRETVVRLLLPVGVMIGYVWLTYPRDSGTGQGLQAARIAQLADSAYFLGFLWTLWALIDSFVLKRATGAETAFRVFGYALVTTAAGMATRLYLLQFRYGVGDQADEAEFTVERRLQIFSTAMQDASRSIQSFHTYAERLNPDIEQLSKNLKTLDLLFVDAHQETTKAIKNNITTVVEEIRGALKTPVQEYGRAIRAFTANVDQQSRLLTEAVKDATEKAHRVIQETKERIGSDHVELVGQLRGQVVRIVEELRGLSDRLASIDLPTDGVKTFAGCFSELERTLAALGTVLGPDGQVRANLSGFANEIQGRSGAVGKALEEFAGRLGSIRVPPEIVIDISNVTQSVEGLQKAVEGLLLKAGDQRWERAPQTASEAVLKLTASVNNLRQSLESADASARNILTEDARRKGRFWPF
jgi:hypothetical protein